ncbi:hypothetical protein B0T17DRAFT_524094 [Bombardia bombarda]|uniref:Uncharacterized protein n=1 Tax=Bombardia bombarda TaxID=252184 RepID=A0AA40C8I4_9PEZI|nr:hypothetical protein B0T17DRAFT_524094 [Bombardia bombarda]
MPLHKSFSDPNRAAKRSQWQRSKSNPTARPAGPARPLAPVSETTKNKLQAFQFELPAPESHEDPSKSNNSATDLAGKENEKPSRATKTSPPPQHLHQGNAATTPVTRLTWQSLLGAQEIPPEDDAASPTGRIIWRNDQNAIVPHNISPMLRKGRKRARSSSPVSSPAGPKSMSTLNIDVKKLAQELKTPHADPALELWDRYSHTGADINTPSGLTNPLLAHLMVSSSPRPNKEGTTAAPASERSLRKAISCGSNWPKRRKADRLDADQASAARGSPRRHSKSSMVSALLETVDGQLKMSKSVEAQMELLKSPSPQKRSPPKRRTQQTGQPGYPDHVMVSPSRGRTIGGQPARLRDNSTDQAAETEKDAISIKSSSDYGDDDFDFDEDTLIELDASVHVGQTQLDDQTLTVADNPVGQDPEPPGSSMVDEFDDLDDDIFDAAEDLIAQVESSHYPSQTVPSIVPQEEQQQGYPEQNVQEQQQQLQQQEQQMKIPENNGQGDDEFDDAFGDDAFGNDFDFEAVELAAATQSAAAANRAAATLLPSSHVRYI